MRSHLIKFDTWLIHFIRRTSIPFARFALFVVFFWFGILKLVGTSPANPMVADLLHATMPFMGWETFIFFFSLYEMLIGISFMAPGSERQAIALLIPHMVMTSLPLLFLPAMTWQGFLTPTLEGQYIIKNLVLIATAMAIAAHLHPIKKTTRKKS
jgi:uncharacterized membrane protein YkgB